MFNEYFAPLPLGEVAGQCPGLRRRLRQRTLVATRGKACRAFLHCIDAAADALSVARERLAPYSNVTIHEASIDAMPLLADDSMEFRLQPRRPASPARPRPPGLTACVRKLKPGAPLLVYIYYAFDNRPAWFRLLWHVSDLIRQSVSKLPFRTSNPWSPRSLRRWSTCSAGAWRSPLRKAGRRRRQLAAQRLSLAQLLFDAHRTRFDKFGIAVSSIA